MEGKSDIDDKSIIQVNNTSRPLIAAKEGDLSFFVSLSSTNNQQVFSLRDDDGLSVLHVAASAGHSQIVEYIAKSDTLEELINAKTHNGWAPIHFAANKGYLDIIDTLVKYGADINLANNCDRTALHYAVTGDWVKTAELLIGLGADVNAQDKVGSVPLHLAAGRGCLDMCKLLIDAGANINVLVNAVLCQQKEVTEMKAKNSEIVCPVSGKIIWKHVCGENGDVSRYKTEFDEIKVIGVGGYACVFECSNKLDGKQYAIKKMDLQELEMDFDYLVREVLAMAVMNHPNIVRYYSAWVEREIAGGFFQAGEERGSYEEVECIGPVLYIQQELCSSSLSELLIGGGLDDKTVWNIFKNIVSGLHHIHGKGVRHGDLSPNNVFFDEDKNAKIGDFGLASLIESGVFGPDSPRARGFYCAPEIKEGNYSLASDIYSLGIILFDMFARYTTHAEKAHAIRQLKENPELISLDNDDKKEKMELILRLTDPDPSLRPNTRFIIELKFISNAI